MNAAFQLRLALVCGFATLALEACVVGPDYKGPPVAAPAAQTAAGFHRAAEAEVDADHPPARWWTELGDPELDRLETFALAQNPAVSEVLARLKESRAELGGARSGLLPTTGAAALYVRTRANSGLTQATSQVTNGDTATGQQGVDTNTGDPQLYNVGFDAVWELDLFGGQRRTIQGARADLEGVQANVADAEVSLTAEIAQAYVNLRAFQARIALSQKSTELERRLLADEDARRAGGVASSLDVERLRSQFESTRAGLVPLRAQVTEALDRLAALTGREPGALDAELSAPTPIPSPPPKVSVGDPAGLLRRRPDIRAAERRIASRTALIGQRTADLFPKVTLLGDIGLGATDPSRLFTGNSFSYVVAPFLQWTPFDFGRVRARIAQAQAERDQAVANYRSTVLNALQDANTALARFGRQREDVAGLARVKASTDRAAAMTQIRFQGGTVTTIDVLDAERQRVSAEQELTQARAQLTQDYVALQKSLGLGWSEDDLRAAYPSALSEPKAKPAPSS